MGLVKKRKEWVNFEYCAFNWDENRSILGQIWYGCLFLFFTPCVKGLNRVNEKRLGGISWPQLNSPRLFAFSVTGSLQLFPFQPLHKPAERREGALESRRMHDQLSPSEAVRPDRTFGNPRATKPAGYAFPCSIKSVDRQISVALKLRKCRSGPGFLRERAHAVSPPSLAIYAAWPLFSSFYIFKEATQERDDVKLLQLFFVKGAGKALSCLFFHFLYSGGRGWACLHLGKLRVTGLEASSFEYSLFKSYQLGADFSCPAGATIKLQTSRPSFWILKPFYFRLRRYYCGSENN